MTVTVKTGMLATRGLDTLESPVKKRKVQTSSVQTVAVSEPSWYTEEGCCLEEFKEITSQQTLASSYPFAKDVQKNIPLYDCRALNDILQGPGRKDLQSEWNRVLLKGPGCFVLKGAFEDTSIIDECSASFTEIIAHQRKQGGGGDHFAKTGANDRVWNAQQKFCTRFPKSFARYFANPFIAATSAGWLGPAYQVTTQLNVIRPGGKAQQAHRDYHMGFQTVQQLKDYPAHAHQFLSPLLTLQGAVAHVDMPIESGPTKLLPFSQQYKEGYMAWRRADFKAYFEDNFVQLPLKKGDVLFFNPALFHAGGSNLTSGATAVDRMANLLQVSSPYGRAMETLDRTAMCKALYPALLEIQKSDHSLSAVELKDTIAACAEGYPFPTNLDLDPPLDEIAPPSQRDLFQKAIAEAWTSEEFSAALDKLCARREA